MLGPLTNKFMTLNRTKLVSLCLLFVIFRSHSTVQYTDTVCLLQQPLLSSTLPSPMPADEQAAGVPALARPSLGQAMEIVKRPQESGPGSSQVRCCLMEVNHVDHLPLQLFQS
jgi:hypothetical protein